MTTTSDGPAGTPRTIDQSYPAVPDAVPEARRSVSRWLRGLSVDVSMSADIELAVSEACTNAVLHGYRGEVSGDFRVCAESMDGVVCVTISDDGGGIVPRSDSPGLGLGLPLIATLTDRLEIRAGAGGTGTVVSMRFTRRVRR